MIDFKYQKRDKAYLIVNESNNIMGRLEYDTLNGWVLTNCGYYTVYKESVLEQIIAKLKELNCDNQSLSSNTHYGGKKL